MENIFLVAKNLKISAEENTNQKVLKVEEKTLSHPENMAPPKLKLFTVSSTPV